MPAEIVPYRKFLDHSISSKRQTLITTQRRMSKEDAFKLANHIKDLVNRRRMLKQIGEFYEDTSIGV